MESTSTSFSSLAGTGSEGHSKSYLNDGSDVSIRHAVDHSAPVNGENESWKGNHYFDNPLHAAVAAVLNVGGNENNNESSHDMHSYTNYANSIAASKQDKEHHWNGAKRDQHPVATKSASANEMHHSFLSALEVQNGGGGSEAQDLSKRHDGTQGVLRQSIVKMEYANEPSQHSQHHPSVLTSLSSSGIIIPSQHVEVIQKVGQHQALSQHMSHEHLSPKSDNDANVLQVMEKMQLPTYDPMVYQRQGPSYNKVPVTNIYDVGSNASAYGLSALPSTQHLLPSAYPNLLTTTQEYYMQRPDYYGPIRAVYPDGSEELLDRIGRPHIGHTIYKPVTVDLPSPVDSGIGQDIMVTPKQEAVDGIFTYTDLQQSVVQQLKTSGKDYHPRAPPNGDRHIVSAGRESPVHIPKIMTSLGFQYTLEAPVSTSVRKEDDRMTYVNKGQFYSITLQYVPDQHKALKSANVKSVLMVVFREEKSPEEEVKCWQFWHTRQHSAKQRILDVDMKNSMGIIGGIEEIAHNGVCFYWSVNEQPVKVNVAVQCLSTDFSNQKGVKGLPLHIQIDTFDEAYSKNIPFHRGYCQIKVFCDKGANRKMLHEQRREEKRKITASPFNCVEGRKKSDGEYHEACERSEFYHMSNLTKPAVLFIPPEDYDRFPPLESFYNVGDPSMSQQMVKDDDSTNSGDTPSPSPKKQKVYPSDRGNNRLMIYVKRPEEHIFTPLHLMPPTVDGLLTAISEKYNAEKDKINHIFKQNKKGITVKMDDDMVRLYCNEDTFLLQTEPQEDGQSFAVTLVELDNPAN